MLEVEVLGSGLLPEGPEPDEVRRLCAAAAARRGVRDGHVAVEFVDAERIAELNGRHRQRPRPTDVLSFPIDGVPAPEDAAPDARPGEDAAQGEADARSGGGAGQGEPGTRPGEVPVELGDVIICPEHTVDVREAVVHGMLHLLGMDHEIDEGEMLALQHELLAEHRP